MPKIQIELNDKVNRLVEIYQASKRLETKEEAINQIIAEAEASIINGVKK